jgi:hypothetical protein
MENERNGRLVSWKEIAAYLGCDVRTCMRWEKERGLPVHRPGGQPGPRVMAWKHELDQWLAGKPNPEADAAPTQRAIASPAERGSISRTWAFVSALIIVGGGLAYLGIHALTMDREPADFRIEGSKLIILNKSGNTLGRFEDSPEALSPESWYRTRLQTRQEAPNDSENGILYPPRLAFEDLDGNGRKEVLFVPFAQSSNNASRLYCLDRRGRPLWPAPFDGGRELTFGGKPFSKNYFTSFEVRDLDGDGEKEILVFAEQNSDWPTQLTVLSHDGRVLGEYWNCGRILDTALADLEGDGLLELIIGGTNAEYKKAFVAIFDPRRVSGASPNSGTFRSSALAAGSELAYFLLPLTDIDPSGDVHTVLGQVEVLDNGRIRGSISRTDLQYEIDPHTLAGLGVTYSIRFRQIHEKAVSEGAIHSDYGAKNYTESLLMGFLYWTGLEWTSTPAWVARRP